MNTALHPEPQHEPRIHLIPYGYAPGDYMSECYNCGEIVLHVDKRATCCRPCAEALYEEDKKNSPPPTLATAPLPFLLAHPPTPLEELPPPDPTSLPREAPEFLPQYFRGLRADTLTRYFAAFQQLPPPITGPAVARVLSRGTSSVLEALHSLEKAGYVSNMGMYRPPKRRSVMVWKWTGPKPSGGIPPTPRG